MRPREVGLIVTAIAFLATLLWTTPWCPQRQSEYAVYVPSAEKVTPRLKLKSGWVFAPESRRKEVSVEEFAREEEGMEGIEFEVRAVGSQLEVRYYGRRQRVYYFACSKRQWLAPYSVGTWDLGDKIIYLTLYRDLRLTVFWLTSISVIAGLVALILASEEDE